MNEASIRYGDDASAQGAAGFSFSLYHLADKAVKGKVDYKVFTFWISYRSSQANIIIWYEFEYYYLIAGLLSLLVCIQNATTISSKSRDYSLLKNIWYWDLKHLYLHLLLLYKYVCIFVYKLWLWDFCLHSPSDQICLRSSLCADFTKALSQTQEQPHTTP